jgi:hypothetical protein
MQKIEKILGSVLGLGIMAYSVGVRIYGIYLRVRESQRSDRGVPSGVQTLFQDGRIEPEPEHSGVQTIFPDENSN